MRFAIGLIAALFATCIFAKLPPPTDEDKAKAAEAAAKVAWADKVGLYQRCVAMDRTADTYRKNAKAAGNPVPTPVATASCSNPGPYVSTAAPAVAKPIEAAGAHSPPGTAVSPPSTKTTAAGTSSSPKQ